MSHEPSPPKETNDYAQLEWQLVLQVRRSWTALSLAVLALSAWVTVGRHLGRFDAPLGWVLALVAAGAGLLWGHSQQAIFRIRRLLGRPIELRHQSG